MTGALKAAEDSRTPRPRGRSNSQSLASASWNAAVFCRFFAYRENAHISACFFRIYPAHVGSSLRRLLIHYQTCLTVAPPVAHLLRLQGRGRGVPLTLTPNLNLRPSSPPEPLAPDSPPPYASQEHPE